MSLNCNEIDLILNTINEADKNGGRHPALC